MPRPVNSSLLNLFNCNGNDSNQIICNNDDCKGKVLFKHSTNLQRHLKVLHPAIFMSYLQTKDALEKKNELHVQKRLIDLVRSKPVLWNSSLTSGDSQESNIKTWKEISQELDIGVDVCRQKWEALRNRFTKELLKKHKSVNEIGRRSPSNERLFSSLQFLRHSEVFQENIENNQPEEIDLLNSHVKEESNNSVVFDNEDASRLQNIADADEDCIDEKFVEKKVKTQLLENENDTERMFLLSLLSYLKKIPQSRRLMVRQRIQGILLEEQQSQEQMYPPVKIENTFAYSSNGQECVDSSNIFVIPKN